MLCTLSCLAFVCLITDCVLALSHCTRKPSSLFIGWAFTRGSEKELETGCLCGWGCDSEPDLVSDMWVGGGVWSWTPKQGHCQPGCSDSLQQKVAWALQREQRCPRPRSPATGPHAQTVLQHHSQLHALASPLVGFKTPAAPTQAGRLIPRHGMMLQLIPVVVGNDGERQRRVYKAQQTPAKQPHRGRGRNILVGADFSVLWGS